MAGNLMYQLPKLYPTAIGIHVPYRIAVKITVFFYHCDKSQYCAEIIYFKARLTPTLCENFTFHAQFQTLCEKLSKLKNYTKTATLCEKLQICI
jgi:hypothetical protein